MTGDWLCCRRGELGGVDEHKRGRGRSIMQVGRELTQRGPCLDRESEARSAPLRGHRPAQPGLLVNLGVRNVLGEGPVCAPPAPTRRGEALSRNRRSSGSKSKLRNKTFGEKMGWRGGTSQPKLPGTLTDVPRPSADASRPSATGSRAGAAGATPGGATVHDRGPTSCRAPAGPGCCRRDR